MVSLKQLQIETEKGISVFYWLYVAVIGRDDHSNKENKTKPKNKVV